LLLFNADQQTVVEFTLPATDEGYPWERMLDTADTEAKKDVFHPDDRYVLQPAALALFCLRTPEEKATLA
jgi:hypothetical protein